MRLNLRDGLQELGWFLEDHCDMILSIIAIVIGLAAIVLRMASKFGWF